MNNHRRSREPVQEVVPSIFSDALGELTPQDARRLVRFLKGEPSWGRSRYALRPWDVCCNVPVPVPRHTQRRNKKKWV